jgi:hypothetical protein
MRDFILVKDDFMSKEWCDSAIEYYENMVGMGFGRDRSQHQTQLLIDDFSIDLDFMRFPVRFTNHADFVQKIWDETYIEYTTKICPILENAEPPSIKKTKIQKTLPGQGYHMWHCESTTGSTSNRLLAFMMYLNTVDEGGETEFLYQSKRITPVSSRFAMWPANFTHVHRGNPPLSGEKYIITGWIEF